MARVRVTIAANRKATMRSLCIVELHVTVTNVKVLSVAQKLYSWRIYVSGNDQMS